MASASVKHTAFSDRKPSVVMVVQSLPPLPSGGAELQALKLAEALKLQGVPVIFITPGVGKQRGYEEISGLPVYWLHSLPNFLLDVLFKIRKNIPQKTTIEYDDRLGPHDTIIRKIGLGARLRYNIFLLNAWMFLRKRPWLTVIHSHTIEWPAYVSALLSSKLKRKLIVKDSTMNGLVNILRYPDGKQKQNLLIEQATFVAMTSAIEKNMLLAGVKADKIVRIPNGIRLSNETKSDFQGSTTVLFAGNLYQQPAKGIDILLKAWKHVIARMPHAHLNIAGDGDLEAYRLYADEQGIATSVSFLGKHNKIATLMLEADVFVLPSRREGMPNVLMEAMLRAVPSIATNISGSQDLIINMQNGILVPPSNQAALADAIIYMLENRQAAKDMALKGRQTILDSYDIDSIALKYANLYLQ